MEKGKLVISIDFELAWGVCDRKITDKDRKNLEKEWELVPRILEMFKEYRTSATWAIVAHLLESECNEEGGVFHPEIPRPILNESDRDWFFQHPRHGDDPIWFAPDLIKQILQLNPTQEIGSHSFGHIPYDETQSNQSAIEADLMAARSVHEKHGLPFDVFVFPRNRMGGFRYLGEQGIRMFRGADPYASGSGVRKFSERVNHLMRFVKEIDPPVNHPVKFSNELTNLPGSMLLLTRNGPRRMVRRGAVSRMGRNGLDKAVNSGGIFHLWFHPSNLVNRTEEQFQELNLILEYATNLRDQNLLEIMPMGKVLPVPSQER